MSWNARIASYVMRKKNVRRYIDQHPGD
ncbi:protein of unknown function [Cupriavidus taiwanensis]|nr:protein of unknown function [Cupriavidus taiwanensis]SOZ02957.1 hypothetical protein CBM2597_A110021 [Cupriavidus taiwanensis]SOZ06233.1 hypothetical protein CBM2595_A80918 [Cupriavidus taiwanensis]SPD41123.1 protein of unknown function [Cupriavidus taiwanensis]